MTEIPLTLSDETLRDGEQQAGVFYSYQSKAELARLIGQTGVDQINLMPAADEGEAAIAKALVNEGFGKFLTAATPIGRTYVDQAKACGFRRLVLFYAVSDRLLFLRDPDARRDVTLEGKTIDEGIAPGIVQRARDNMLARVGDSVRYATRELGLRVDFAAEDASRADRDFLVQCLRELGPPLDHFLLCDTVGILEPTTTTAWVEDLRRAAPDTRLGAHFHNDFGLALENTLQAVLAGAAMVSGTFGGIGERAGNVALEQVVSGLRARFGLRVAEIDDAAVVHVTAYLEGLGLRPAPPYSQAAQRHVSGMHVQSLLQDRRSYCVFPHLEPEIWFGKMSGASNFQYLFEKTLGRALPRSEYARLSTLVKKRAQQEQRCFSTTEVIALLEAGALG